MTLLLAGLALALRGQGLLLRVVPRPTGRNGYEEYLSAGEALGDPLARAYADWTPGASPDGEASRETVALWTSLGRLAPLDARREESKRFGRALDLVARGNAKPVFEPRIEFGPDTPMPEYASFRRIAKFAARAATVDAADGRTDRAVDLLLDQLIFADNAGRSFLIANLVGSAIQGIAFAAFDDLLPRLSRADTFRIERAVDGLLARPVAARAVLPMERKMILAGLDLAFASTGPVDDLFSDDEGRRGAREKAFADEFAGMSLLERRAMFRRLVGRLEARDGAADRVLAGPERGWADGMASLMEVDAEESPANLEDALISMLTPVYSGFVSVAVRSRTQLRLLGIHARLAQYRWDYGRYPERLDLTDPLTGGPYVYERRDDGTIRLASRGIPQTGEIELLYRRIGSEGNGTEP